MSNSDEKLKNVEAYEELVLEEVNIFSYRIFDIGSQLYIDEARKILEKGKTIFPFGLKSDKRSLLISERPLVIHLEAWVENIDEKVYDIRSTCKLWSFGAASVRIMVRVQEETSFRELAEIGSYLENNPLFHEKIVDQIKQLINVLEPAIEKPNLWGQYEDYLIYDIRKLKNFSGNLSETFAPKRIASLILGEREMTFSQQTLDSIKANYFQYTEDDLVVMHWNAALIYDLDDVRDIILTIEFALCSLLEMRFYDDFIDHQLNKLYASIEVKGPALFSNSYKELSNSAALHYIDVSELVDRVENAFKVVGEYYYARIFRMALDCFYISDWKKNVNEKLNSLAEISNLFQGEVDERRNLVMTLIIIALIAFEAFPLFYKIFERF